MDHEQWEQMARSANPIPFHENVVCFDVDETLFLWSRSGDSDAWLIDPTVGTLEGGLTHREHIERIKKHSKDGHFVIVWSGGGGEYARNACIGLGISKYVNLCLDKPMQYYDDLDCKEWLGRRTYIGGSLSSNTDYIGDWSER